MIEVVRDPAVMGGDPVVEGTDILAETIMSDLRSGHSPEQISRGLSQPARRRCRRRHQVGRENLRPKMADQDVSACSPIVCAGLNTNDLRLSNSMCGWRLHRI